MLKSGVDFRQLSHVTISFSDDKIVDISLNTIEITSKVAEDEKMKEIVAHEVSLCPKIEKVIAYLGCELDCRFSVLRTQETNMANLVADMLRTSIKISRTARADCALLNSGTLRADCIFPKGAFHLTDLTRLLPIADAIVVLQVFIYLFILFYFIYLFICLCFSIYLCMYLWSYPTANYLFIYLCIYLSIYLSIFF